MQTPLYFKEGFGVINLLLSFYSFFYVIFAVILHRTSIEATSKRDRRKNGLKFHTERTSLHLLHSSLLFTDSTLHPAHGFFSLKLSNLILLVSSLHQKEFSLDPEESDLHPGGPAFLSGDSALDL